MIAFLLKLVGIKPIKKGNKPASEEQREYITLKASAPYSILTLLLFGMQGIIATIGATGLVFPDLPNPVSHEMGRAIHLNFSMYWPLLGIMGLIYYFFIRETESELYSLPLAYVQFWLFFITFTGIVLTLAFGIAAGREYREAATVFKIGIITCLALFVFNLLKTYRQSSTGNNRIIPLTMVLGAVLLLLFDIPNVISYIHPTIDETVRFWVVHLWEELCKELLSFGIFAALIMELAGVRIYELEKAYLVQSILLITGAMFATGHHYFWIGVPAIWFFVGTVFSLVQTVAILLMLYIGYIGCKNIKLSELNTGTRLALGFICCSVIYHVSGAAVMGMIMSIPWINQYSHGTYITSAHSHLALFGAIGMLILGGCTYILTKKLRFSKTQTIFTWSGLILINTGLVVMSVLLIIAGFMQTYLWRALGESFMTVQALIRPYLILRAGGGAVFALGGILYVFTILSMVWRHRALLFSQAQ